MTGKRESVETMLADLGYRKAQIADFQRDYNRTGADPVLVTGALDEDTEEALRFAHGGKAAFVALRDRKKGN